MDEPIAQGQPPAAESAGNSSQAQVEPASPGQHEGFQKRIDELTAARREAERHNEALRQQLTELTNSVVQMSQSQVQAPPPVEISPDERAKMEYLLGPLQKQLEELRQQNAAQLGQIRFQQALQGKDPRVAARAHELLTEWRKDPAKGGWTPEDALIYASGQLGIPINQGQPRDERGRFNGAGSTMTHQTPPPNLNGNQTAGQEPNWDSTPPEKLAEFYAKRLGDKAF